MQQTLLRCGVMLDINSMRRRLDAAVERFVGSALAVAIEFYAHAQAQQAARAPARQPKVTPARKQPRVRRPRSSSPIYRAPLVPVASEEVMPRPVRLKPKGPTPEKIALGVLRLTTPSPNGFTFEELTSSVRVAPDTLRPVLEQLVAAQKVRVVTEGNVTTYRRPRIEPIRRRRDEP